MPKVQNTLQQDLFLLAKSGYQNTGLDAADAASLICAYHVLIPGRYMRAKDTSYWLLKEFVESGIILSEPGRMNSFLLDLNTGFFGWKKLGDGKNGFAEYHYNLTHGLLGVLRTTRVRDGDKNLMPFDLPTDDPVLLEILNSAGKLRTEEGVNPCSEIVLSSEG